MAEDCFFSCPLAHSPTSPLAQLSPIRLCPEGFPVHPVGLVPLRRAIVHLIHRGRSKIETALVWLFGGIGLSRGILVILITRAALDAAKSFRVLLARRQRAASNCWTFFSYSSTTISVYLSIFGSTIRSSYPSSYPSSFLVFTPLLLLPHPTDTPSLLHKACWPSFTPFLAVYNS